MHLETIYENESSERDEGLEDSIVEELDEPPIDRWNLVYLVGVVLGFVQVLPWNVLSMASDKYFTNLKFNTTELRENGSQSSFIHVITMICLATHFAFSTINTVLQSRAGTSSDSSLKSRASSASQSLKSKHRRILFAIAVMLITLIMHAVFAMLDTSSWSTAFYWVTVISAVILMSASGLYQSNTFGLFANLPMTYTNALVLGNNVCGSLVAILNLCAQLFDLDGTNSLQLYAVYFFTSAIIILLLAFNCYCALPTLNFFRYHTSLADQRRQIASIERMVDHFEHDDVEIEKSLLAFANRTGFSVDSGNTSRNGNALKTSVHGNGNSSSKSPFGSPAAIEMEQSERKCDLDCSQCGARWPPYGRMFLVAWPHFLTIWNCFFCTLALYPSILSRVSKSDASFFISAELYSTIMCFLVFNVFSMIGNMVAQYVLFPSSRWLWLAVLLRTLISIPLFVLCNYVPPAGTSRLFPVLINNDWAFLAANVLFAFTNGHFSGLAMMYAPRQFEDELRSWAGMLSAFFLVLGLFSGAAFSFAIAAVVQSVPLDSAPQFTFALNLTTSAYA